MTEVEIKSYKGYIVTPDGKVYGKNKALRKLSIGVDGSYYFSVYDKMHVSTVPVHRAVAELYVPNPNPEKYKYVVHKDGDKKNNYYTNLEWSERTTRLIGFKTSKQVCMCSKDGEVIKEYFSITAAADDNDLKPVNVSNYLHGRGRDKRGYVWKFA